MITPVRLLVFGGRNYQNRAHVHEGILQVTDGVPFRLTTLIHGKCRTGTDFFAHEFCERWASWGITEISVAAAWDDLSVPGAVIRQRDEYRQPYNIKAGFDRNQKMLDEWKPTHALGTQGGTGTADMLERIENAIRNGANIVLKMID